MLQKGNEILPILGGQSDSHASLDSKLFLLPLQPV